ncbi:3-dehydroquinate synthase [Schaalia sp. 19OD2882]|uniref:3-dehydroquinate synthase n=1 Tax=Schaalia sp. 19OD2882 TaxID=2794089 RepID=UPI001C1EF37A|nr:3-dehydroquinate synthase [Schaalia sp. 19OD2882]QWW18716.1 3-dehydroquinate synthase [Schaalia sp. 19OD2882]
MSHDIVQWPLRLPIVMVGLPGAGKSKVGRLLAQALGVVHVDTDDLVEADQGRSVSQIFADEGEAAFREHEARAVARALETGGVVSLGGGAVSTPTVRELLRGHDVVLIDVEHDELLRRVTRKTHRPLLREDPDGALRRLREEREPLYREVATHVEPSDDGPAEEVADRILARVAGAPRVVRVAGATPYDVLVGRGLGATHVRAALREDCTKVLLVHAGALAARAQDMANALRLSGLEVVTFSHPEAEAGKTIEVVAELWDIAGEMRLGRHDALVAMGGGATTDMAGFVAATWLRGVDVVHVPTTLLGMVDAAVGGKTGINTSVGKNLVGSFHCPRRVVVDLDHLHTLPVDDLRAGMAEVVKCGFIQDLTILDLVREHGLSVLDPSSSVLEELVIRAISVKARVVAEDLQEAGLREILNYGHTLAHAIERREDYRWRHGDAVAVGCTFAARLSAHLGLLDPVRAEEHSGLLAALGLPTTYSGARLDELIEVMTSDKKVRAGQLRFVLLEDNGRPIVRSVDAAELTVPAKWVGVDVR